MRSIVRAALLALLAVLALGAVLAASASAVEFEKPFPNKFEVKGPAITLSSVGNRTVLSCSSVGQFSGTGEITGATALTATFAFKSCSDSAGRCASAGAKAEEIKTELEGTLVSIENGQAVGVLFKHKGGGNFAEFTCGTTEKETVKVRGSVIGVISFANVTGNQFRLVFSEKKGVQEPAEYNEKVKAVLEAEGSGKEAFAFEQTGYLAGESETASHLDELLTTEATKIKAILKSRGLPEFGPYEAPAAHITLEGGASGPPFFELHSGSQWEYREVTVIKGNLISPNELAMTITFSGGSEGACLNNGTKLVTNTLIGRLGYLSKASKEVGLLLEPIGRLVVKCGSALLGGQEWIGAVLGKVTPVTTFGELTKTHKLVFEKGPNSGEQLLQKFEGEATTHTLGDIFQKQREEQLALGGKFELKSAIAIEIRA
jgi:hypothetical protein